MRRNELPAEVDRRPLSYPDLVEVLSALAGERVIVHADAATGAPVASGSPGLSLAGVLAVVARGGDCTELAIGEPEGAGGGRLRISAAAVSHATLSTFDGNDFVIVRVQMPDLLVVIQDENSGAL